MNTIKSRNSNVWTRNSHSPLNVPARVAAWTRGSREENAFGDWAEVGTGTENWDGIDFGEEFALLS